MGLNLLRLYCVSDSRTLVDKSGQSYTIPGLYQGDKQGIEFRLLQAEAGSIVSGSPYSEVLTTQYTLKIGVFKTDGTTLAFRSDWDTNGSTAYTGKLALDTAAMNSAIGSNPFITAVFAVEVSDSNGDPLTAFQQQITVYKDYITNATVSELPTDEAAAQSWVRSYAMPRVLSAGEVIVLVSPDGLTGLELGVNDDGTMKANKITI